MTNRLVGVFESIGIPVIDHLIVAGPQAFSMAGAGLLESAGTNAGGVTRHERGHTKKTCCSKDRCGPSPFACSAWSSSAPCSRSTPSVPARASSIPASSSRQSRRSGSGSSPAPRAWTFSGDAEAFHLAIEALRIRLAYEYDPHFAVNASAITPLPHQLDAVYRYMLKSPLVRLLLADDPGAGKTIMAGLLLKELRFRGLADRVLIVLPPLVSRQWQEELSEKFSEEFTIVDNGVLKANVGRNPWTENDRCITSVYWAARDNVLETLKEADWDLVIADEAHKMAAYRQGVRAQKTRKTRLYRLGEELSVRTKHLLLLTATPHKGDPENFRLLLELLDKDLFADRHILEEAMSSADNPIILRRLKEEMCRFDGSPLFPQRTVKTVTFDLSRAERALYDAVTEYVTEHFNKAMQEEKRNVGFAMTILQRRLTSSLAAITASLNRRHERLQELLDQVRALAAAKARTTLRDGTSDAALDDLRPDLAPV